MLKCFYFVKKQIVYIMRNRNKSGSGIKSIGKSPMGLQKVAKHFKPILCYFYQSQTMYFNFIIIGYLNRNC